jgi:hypothetical protein
LTDAVRVRFCATFLRATCVAAGLVKGEGQRQPYHGKAPNELDWTEAQRQKRAVAGYLAGLEAETQVQEEGVENGA